MFPTNPGWTTTGPISISSRRSAVTIARPTRPALVAAVLLLAGAFVTALGVTGLAYNVGGHAGQVSRGIRHLLTHPAG